MSKQQGGKKERSRENRVEESGGWVREASFSEEGTTKLTKPNTLTPVSSASFSHLNPHRLHRSKDARKSNRMQISCESLLPL